MVIEILIFLIAGDIRQFHEDSSSEDTSPSEHKNMRSRTLGGDRWVREGFIFRWLDIVTIFDICNTHTHMQTLKSYYIIACLLSYFHAVIYVLKVVVTFIDIRYWFDLLSLHLF